MHTLKCSDVSINCAALFVQHFYDFDPVGLSIAKLSLVDVSHQGLAILVASDKNYACHIEEFSVVSVEYDT